jgi:RNA polymerase sigma-70 factor, ECF subfamily
MFAALCGWCYTGHGDTAHSQNPMTDHDSPENLLRRIAARDQSALSELYQRYARLVHNLAFRILERADLAEEITQDVFLKVWNQTARYDSTRGTFATWLLAITRNAAIDRLRQEQRRPSRDAVDLDALLDVLGSSEETDNPTWQDGRLLRELLIQLPAEQRQVIELGFFQGFSHQEIADRLEQPLGTVKTRARLALQKLKGLWLEATRQK